MKNQKDTDHRKSSPATVYELKKVALKLRKNNKTVKEIVEITGLSDQTVRNLFRQYDEGGLSAIKPKTRGRKQGEKRHLTPKQEKEIFSILVDENPDQLKLQGCLWTRDNVRELILRKYGIAMPIRTIGEYLKRWGLTVQRPAKREMEQKPEQVKAWLDEQYPSIHKEAKAEKAVIFWGDETAVQNTANYARGYSPKGKTPILKVKAKKMHINMISAINNQGKLHFLLYSDAILFEHEFFLDAVHVGLHAFCFHRHNKGQSVAGFRRHYLFCPRVRRSGVLISVRTSRRDHARSICRHHGFFHSG